MPTILLADDYASLRKLLKQELEGEGYRVLVARDGKEAIEILQTVQPDLVVLDHCMPRLSGLEAAEAIAAMEPRIPVILFTNHDQLCIGDPRSALAAACVEKREDLTELKEAIAAVLAGREQEGSSR